MGQTKLHYNSQQLTELPEELHFEQDAEMLSLYNNKLTHLPDWLWDMQNLRFLNLGEKQA